MLARKLQIALKLETTEGTAVTVAAADADLYVNEVSFTPDIQTVPRNPLRATLTNLPHLIGKKGAQISFKTELTGSGTAGTAPSLGDALKACACKEVVVAATSVTYTPDSTKAEGDGTSASIGLFIDGKRLTIYGARGTQTIEYKAGEAAFLVFTFTGIYGGVTDTPLLAGITYPTPTPKVWLGETLTLGGVTLVADTLTFDAANTVTLRSDVTKASGYRAASITERVPTISVDPEEVLVATRDDWGKLENGTASAVNVTLTGSAGNIVTLTAPTAVVSSISQSDREGIQVNQLDLALASVTSAGDDEWSLAFT